MSNFVTINLDDFKKLKVQIIAVFINCSQNDMCSIVNLETHTPCNISIIRKNNLRYLAMYVNVENYEESVELCLKKTTKIKNLKSIAFPEKLLLQKGINFEEILQKFVNTVNDNNIKVYILKETMKILGETTISDTTPIHLSFGNLLGQIEIWKNNKSGWSPFFVDRIKDGIIPELNKFLQNEKCTIFPEPNKIFNAMVTTKLIDIKVIIIGQDPYHTPGAAMGLAFSHEDGHKKIQPSLKNIYKEVIACGYKVNPKSGDLSKWANQGVFLINTALTVQQGKPNSHSKEWVKFTEKLFSFINEKVKHSVVIMWGNHAQSYEKYFDSSRHKIMKSAHPSPFSANSGFFGSKPFIICNEQLKIWGMKEIDWNL